MTYALLRREVLSHINQYTMAGSPVAASYNNQEDYLVRIPGLLNDALLTIQLTAKRERTVEELTDPEEVGGLLRYELPADFYQLLSGGVSRIRRGRLERTNAFTLQGRRYLLVPKAPEGEEEYLYTVEYIPYPHLLPPEPADDFDLPEPPEVLSAATYYAAAQLVVMEDEFTYSALHNEYENRMALIAPGVTAELEPVADIYNFGLRI